MRMDNDLYDYLQACWEENQRIPSQREMVAHLDITQSCLRDALTRLAARGQITWEKYRARGISLSAIAQPHNEHADTVYGYLIECDTNGYMPSQQEIADAVYLSRGSVRQALIWLEAQGRVQRGKGQRSIRMVITERTDV